MTLPIYKHEKILKTGYGAFKRPMALVEVPEGEEVAGSGTRHVKHCYRVVSTIGGTRHSKAYSSLNDALIEFNRLTTPIEEIRA